MIFTKFHEDRAKIEEFLVIAKFGMCASFFLFSELVTGNFFFEFKGKIKDVSFTPKGVPSLSPNVSF